MNRISGAVTLVFLTSFLASWGYEKSRRDNLYSTTQPSGYHSNGYYSNGYYYNGGHRWFGGGYGSGSTGSPSGIGHSSGITRGGFGSTGHAAGGHS